ncbi:unnamed protein product [Staurois parvus]|uniref:Uncharacterized protein n=1 Tax=Staurois parvus TaxID=386267 RepID=A0ABN9AFE0_9NEOB|nr:unnamed protein product [Staurois parvus]
MRCVHDLTDPGLLCICCSSALISIPGSNLISIPGSNLISFLAATLVTEGCSHTWMSSDSQLTRPPSFTILQNMAAVSSSCSLSTRCENSTSL